MEIPCKVQDVLPAKVKLAVNTRMSPTFAEDQKLDPQIQDSFLQECKERAQHARQEYELRQFALQNGRK